MESKLEPQCGLGSQGDGQKPVSVLINSDLRLVTELNIHTYLALESEVLKEEPGGGGAGVAASWAIGEPAD